MTTGAIDSDYNGQKWANFKDETGEMMTRKPADALRKRKGDGESRSRSDKNLWAEMDWKIKLSR